MNYRTAIRSAARRVAPLRWARRSLATTLLAIGLGTALGQVALPSFAQGRAKTEALLPVSAELTQAKVFKGPDGKEQLVDATSVKPGDVIEYRAVYTNHTVGPIAGVIATLPIPDGLEYVPKSAKPGGALVKAATKEGVYGLEPLTQKVNDKTELVAYPDYRVLRWTLGQLPAGGVSVVSLRATVQVFVPPVAAAAGSDALPQAPPLAAQKTNAVFKP